jgi:hypothetical protein
MIPFACIVKSFEEYRKSWHWNAKGVAEYGARLTYRAQVIGVFQNPENNGKTLTIFLNHEI